MLPRKQGFLAWQVFNIKSAFNPKMPGWINISLLKNNTSHYKKKIWSLVGGCFYRLVHWSRVMNICVGRWGHGKVLTWKRFPHYCLFYTSLNNLWKKTVYLPVIWDTMTLMWRHCNVSLIQMTICYMFGPKPWPNQCCLGQETNFGKI